MEGLSLMLKQALSEGKNSGIKTSRFIKKIHLLFVDDILILNKARVSYWEEIATIIYALCRALGMDINPSKSLMHFSEGTNLNLYKSLFPFNFVGLDIGLK
jgi:hypothetical protein